MVYTFEMDRRGFLKLFGAGVAGIAIEQAIPLGRVWSFPSILERLFSWRRKGELYVPELWINREVLEKMQKDLAAFYEQPSQLFRDGRFKVGSTLQVKAPQAWLIPAGGTGFVPIRAHRPPRRL